MVFPDMLGDTLPETVQALFTESGSPNYLNFCKLRVSGSDKLIELTSEVLDNCEFSLDLTINSSPR